MKWLICLAFTLCATSEAAAQRVLTLDSCRQMALNQNKRMAIAGLKVDAARNVRKSARTQYLPRITAMGGYLYSSREISLLNASQKAALGSLGTSSMQGLAGSIHDFTAGLTDEQWGAIDAALEPFGTNSQQAFGQMDGQMDAIAQHVDAQGKAVADAFRTDTRHMFAGAVVLTQPLFMGGSIVATNKMADIGEQIAASGATAQRQTTISETDQAYWTIVSLSHKRRLAESYLDLVGKLDGDMTKLIREGMATRAEGLAVKVRLNEAEMTLAQVDDGLALARMALCQKCGMALDEAFVLPEESADSIAAAPSLTDADASVAMANRPDLHVIEGVVDLSRQATNVLRAASLPQIMLVGGYTVSNPNVYDGFRNKFGGAWNVGVVVRVPVWNWGDVAYKVRASRGATAIAELQLAEAREGVELQLTQARHRLSQAQRRLRMAKASAAEADENLRSANLGFGEGVMGSTTVMEAQAAWLKARSSCIDAEIDVQLSQVALERALGTL